MPLEKKELRRSLLAERESIEHRLRLRMAKDMSENLKRFLLNQPLIKKIFCFIAFKSEPNLFQFICQFNLSQSIYIPHVIENEIKFALWEADLPLKANQWGVLEPMSSNKSLFLPDSESLVLTPALALNKEGFRLGYGGGYYDRLFAKATDSVKMGCVFSQFFPREIPTDTWDLAMEYVLTDKEITQI